MVRFFDIAKGFEEHGVNLPKRSTKYAAGYDFEAVEDTVIPSIWRDHADLIQRKGAEITSYDTESLHIPEFFTLENTEKAGFKPTLVKTGVKAIFSEDEVLYLYNRSSNPKRGLILANGTGVVDFDYAFNEDNDGAIMFPFLNFGQEDYVIKKGDRIGQGVFAKFLTTYDDTAEGTRESGFGSTGK